jgi:fructose-bisphosphate aldolase class II
MRAEVDTGLRGHMALTSGLDVLRAARAGGYAVPAFNIFNLEMLQAAYRAAEAERAPIIVQVSPRSVAYAGLRPLAALAHALAEPVSVPVVLHLDHGPGLVECQEALEAGFTSVMYDGADLPYAENVRMTRQVVAAAHAHRAAAEAELGQVGHAGQDVSPDDLTDPAEAARFVAETGVDALAVAIGTLHGMTATVAVLDIERIAALAQQTDAALVMHGSSGVDDDTLRRAVAAGIRKVNLSTALQRVFMETLRESAAAPGHETDARAVLADARDAVIAAARHRIRLLGAAGRG